MKIVAALIFGIIYFLCGAGILIYMSQFDCKKKDIGTSFIDAATMGGFMTIIYLLLPYMGFLTNPVKNIMLGFHVSESLSTTLSNFYVLMLFSWVITTWFGLKIQSKVCKPSKTERKKFKQELQNNLSQMKIKNGNNPSLASQS